METKEAKTHLLKANILLNNYQDSLARFQQMSEDSQGQKAPTERAGGCSNAERGDHSTFQPRRSTLPSQRALEAKQ